MRPSQINDYNDNLKTQGINPKSKATTSFGLSEGSKASGNAEHGEMTIGQTPNVTKNNRMGDDIIDEDSKLYPVGAFSIKTHTINSKFMTMPSKNYRTLETSPRI
jgi:hypothetical protein